VMEGERDVFQDLGEGVTWIDMTTTDAAEK
jgi:hypothetical protein